MNALLSSLDIDSSVQAKEPIHARFRELDDYWNESQGIVKPAFHATDGWVAEFTQQQTQHGHGHPQDWAHSFEHQHGANGWASEFEQARTYSF